LSPPPLIRDYYWSSYRANAQGKNSVLVKPHTLYSQLDHETLERNYVYRCMFEHQLDEHDVHNIREAAQFSMPLGNDRFRQQIETTLGRALGQAKRGRPCIKEPYLDYY